MTRASAPIDSWQRRCGTVLLVAIGLLLLALVGRLVHINTALRPRLLAAAERQRRSLSTIPARRGMIVDTRGRVVATSRRLFDVFVDPHLVDDLEALSAELGVRISVPPSRIVQSVRRRAHSRFVVVARRVDDTTAASVRAMGHAAVGLEDHEIRTYPLGASMSHVLGFVGYDGHGLEGLELAQDEHLRGRDGRRATIRDARRRALWSRPLECVPPVDGGQVVLTIDAEIQRIVEAELRDAVVRAEAESGVAVLISPDDGDILAMACYPTFDPADAANTPPELRRNRAVTDPTEPGSTFKPFILSGALDGGFVTRHERFDCHMGMHAFGRRIVRDTSPHGMLDIRSIVIKSSNIGMAQVGMRMGNAALYATMRRFGFGEPTGIDVPGETSGLVYPLHRWTSYSTTSVPMGYEVAVTPLQLATAFSAILNGGRLLRPRLVRELRSCDGTTVASFDGPDVIREAVSPETAAFITQDILVAVVAEGTGRRARAGPYRVLGKTGTAKLPYRNRRGYEPGAYLGTFIGAAPADHPEVVAVVMICRPNSKLAYYGGTVAGPAVGKMLESTLSYLGVAPANKDGLLDPDRFAQGM